MRGFRSSSSLEGCAVCDEMILLLFGEEVFLVFG